MIFMVYKIQQWHYFSWNLEMFVHLQSLSIIVRNVYQSPQIMSENICEIVR